VYYLIGFWLLLTFLLVINLISTALLSAAWRFLFGRAEDMRPRSRATLIFALRAFPVGAAILFVLGFVIPAFVIYEPIESGETIGFKQIAVLAVGVVGVVAAAFRVFASWWRTRRLVADWLARSERVDISGIDVPAFRLTHEFPVFAVVGVFRPRLFIAEQVLAELDVREIDAVVQHEVGHLDTSDNLRRLTMQLCGDLLVVPIGRSLDRDWTTASEIAADEFAVRTGGRESALSLASALIKIARLIPANRITIMPTGSFAVQDDSELLSSRIQRLVAISESGTTPNDRSFSRGHEFTFWAFGILAVLAPLALDTYFLAEVHAVSELLLAALR